MKYTGLPAAIWVLYKKSFRDNLVTDLGYDIRAAKRISAGAKPIYRQIKEIITDLGYSVVSME